MLKNNKKILAGLLLLTGLSQYVFASDESVKIAVIFNNVKPSSNLNSIYLGNTYDMTCAGEGNEYYLANAGLADKVRLDITVDGPFKNDNRTTCNPDTIDDNQVYFTLDDLPIHYIYNNNPYTCIINQNVGTSYNHGNLDLGGGYSKLQGEIPDTILPCGGKNTGGAMYEVLPGHASLPGTYYPGQINIYLPSPESSINTN